MTREYRDVSQQTKLYIGDRIKRQREARHWTRADLERQSGVAYNTLKALENGETGPTLSVLLDLSRAFGLTSLDELLGGVHILFNLETAPTPKRP